MSSLLVRTLIDVHRIIANTETIQRKTWNKIHKICYANNEEFWACRADHKSLQFLWRTSEVNPIQDRKHYDRHCSDKKWYLVYTDSKQSTVNVVKSTEIN